LPSSTLFPYTTLFRSRKMGMGTLAQFPFLSLKSDLTTGMHDRVLKIFRESGHEPRILCECSSVAIILSLVAAGIGATILPKSVLDRKSTRLNSSHVKI